MYNITMIENNELIEIQILDTMNKEMLKDADAFLDKYNFRTFSESTDFLNSEGIDGDPVLKRLTREFLLKGESYGILDYGRLETFWMDGDEIIGTSGMSFVEKPPYFGCPSGRIGLLSSMFTNPNYRRKGIAKELLSRVVDEAKKYGCGTVQITASDMGVKLYTDFGFKHNDNFMHYKL